MCLTELLRRVAAAALSVAVIGCAEPSEPGPDPEAAAEIGPAEALPRTLPAPDESQPRFVGLWATAQNGCSAPPWTFRADGVQTQGEVSCDFTNPRMTETGYIVSAICHAEGDITAHDIQFSFAESARSMMVSDGPWAGATSLVYCGPLPAP